MCCIVGLTTVGALDDRFDLSVKIRMAVQACISFAMIYYAGTNLHTLGNLIGFGNIDLGYLSTVITIFAGGSAGKEGPAAQIGAGVASFLADTFRFTKEHRKKIVICGISAGFAAVFGTPISGAIFGVEVLIVGIIMYDVLLPSLVAGFAAFTTAQFLGLHYSYFDMRFSQAIPIELSLIAQVVLAGLFFGLIADFFITFLKYSSNIIKSFKMNAYLKAFLGGSFLIVLSFFFGEEYFGLGLDTVNNTFFSDNSVTNDIPWYAFILKTIFTTVTLGTGGSGGVLTPLFFVGATSGNLFGTLMGDHIAFFSAIGFVSLLAGATNAPIASIIMAVELFGIEIAPYAAISIVITFLITGHRSVFPSQILKMKKSDMLDISMGEDMDHSSANIRQKDKQKFKELKQKLKSK